MTEIQNINNFDNSSLVLSNGDWKDIALSAPGAIIYPIGTVLAFNATTGKYEITKSGTADVANAKAVLVQETEFTGAGDKLIRAVIGGEVDQNLLVFDGSDTLATIPAGADDSFGLQLRNYGILAIDPTQNTMEDNQ